MLMAAHTHRACPFVAAHYFDTGKVATVTAHKNLSLTKSYLQSSSINLSDKNLGPSPILMLGAVLSTPSSAAVERVNVLGNQLGESVDLLIDVFNKTERIRTMLGIDEGTVNLDLSGRKLDPAYLRLLTTELIGREHLVGILGCGQADHD